MAYTKYLLDNIQEVTTTLHGNCNADVSATKTKGWWRKFHMWVNEKGMVNLLSVPCLEEDRYIITYNTQKEWVVTTTKGIKIPF